MAKTPSNKSVRKPQKKKVFNLDKFKVKTGTVTVPDKPVGWIKLSPALQEATGIQGFAKGYLSLCRGFTNSGKSTAAFEAAVEAQRMGLLPIIFDIENNLGFQRMEKLGFDWEKPHILIHNDYLLDNFGKVKNKDAKEASIEDLADAIHFFINQQELGELPMELVFIIDSIGVLDCLQTINALEKGTAQNNMWNAAAYEHAFKSLLNTRIPASRRENSQYTNTIIAVQKIWIDSMGKGAVKHKGGEAIHFAARLIFHFGGVAGHSTKEVEAQSLNRKVAYGIKAPVKVPKNHVDDIMGGISMKGEIISTPHGFVSPTKLEAYKKDNILFFRKILGDENLSPEQIKTKYNALNTVGGDDDELNLENIDEDFADKYKEVDGDIVDLNSGEVKEDK